MTPTHQDLSNDTTFNQIKSRVPVPLRTGQIRDYLIVIKMYINLLSDRVAVKCEEFNKLFSV